MLKINNLNVTTLKGRKLISDFSFVLNDGEHIALIGEEGNGKSTLLKIIAGEDVSNYVNCSGQISADETVGYLHQQLSTEYNDRTVLEYLSHDESGGYDLYEHYGDLLEALNSV
ncbi:MAG: ATP-binding cassette domain-containing protein, partial [Erysipelotrichaceae bacterium]|nr:ATP-binding cassette domain-containing protein [Erysipelotrichaceae bacterium]